MTRHRRSPACTHIQSNLVILAAANGWRAWGSVEVVLDGTAGDTVVVLFPVLSIVQCACNTYYLVSFNRGRWYYRFTYTPTDTPTDTPILGVQRGDAVARHLATCATRAAGQFPPCPMTFCLFSIGVCLLLGRRTSRGSVGRCPAPLCVHLQQGFYTQFVVLSRG